MPVGLVPGHTVLDGDPTPLPKKGAEPQNFRPMFIIVTVISLEHCTGVKRYWFAQVQVKFTILCILFLESLIVLSLYCYAQLHHCADSCSRSCELVSF